MSVPVSVLDGESTTALVARAAQGDQAAWRALVDRYRSIPWAVAREHRLAESDAADVSQATWLTLAEHLGDIREPERLAGWLATTARRESLRVLAVRRREVPADWVDAEPWVPGPADRVADTDRDIVLWRAVGELPERCRSLLRLLACSPSLSHAQAAAALGIRVNSIGKTRVRCLAALRRRLATAGVTR